MIHFDNEQWTEEQAMYRVNVMIEGLVDPVWAGDDGFNRAGERRLLALLKAIREARKTNEVAA